MSALVCVEHLSTSQYIPVHPSTSQCAHVCKQVYTRTHTTHAYNRHTHTTHTCTNTCTHMLTHVHTHANTHAHNTPVQTHMHTHMHPSQLWYHKASIHECFLPHTHTCTTHTAQQAAAFQHGSQPSLIDHNIIAHRTTAFRGTTRYENSEELLSSRRLSSASPCSRSSRRPTYELHSASPS